jgi:hypothetical protein
LTEAEPLDVLLTRFWQGGVLEILDHECAGLLPDSARHYSIWQLTPSQFHLVEWVAHGLAHGN